MFSRQKDILRYEVMKLSPMDSSLRSRTYAYVGSPSAPERGAFPSTCPHPKSTTSPPPCSRFSAAGTAPTPAGSQSAHRASRYSLHLPPIRACFRHRNGQRRPPPLVVLPLVAVHCCQPAHRAPFEQPPHHSRVDDRGPDVQLLPAIHRRIPER